MRQLEERDAMIDKLQNYYGIAIRSNLDDLKGMKKAIYATLFHCASNDKVVLHDYCPDGSNIMPDAMIDKLQIYYGIAIRSNLDDLKGMKKAIYATLFHCASNDKVVLHDYCPDGSNSWCGYKRDSANKTKTFKHGSGLPKDIIALMKPIYLRLSDDELLKKCLHGKTQNQNESFNAMIWQRVPKEVFVARPVLEFGLYDAVAHFNQGSATVVDLYRRLKIDAGKYTNSGCTALDSGRIYGAEYKERDIQKKRRKVRCYAASLAPRRITANCIIPGLTDTETIVKMAEVMHLSRENLIAKHGGPNKLVLQPEDIANAVGFLCSQEARFITGAVINVDGGRILTGGQN
ncbi:predicted protein [Nematostella vectensis]|uniref:Uncharacterized protein n=1 Tax=Nematostella vectensis TaxID=45351 RepID=A7SS52_NEMVE|nr:predicted protein [Nematostella vectensis]|eukprot:XP_001625569.1 predicted protein [Nematostella vectensis]